MVAAQGSPDDFVMRGHELSPAPIADLLSDLCGRQMSVNRTVTRSVVDRTRRMAAEV
ncbi:MAG TPA: hypothetical protein VEM93_07935 [Actinomycetota bacterium]|nr:hypothetical protein [Actinomycetota bacterium]